MVPRLPKERGGTATAAPGQAIVFTACGVYVALLVHGQCKAGLS